MARDPEPAEVEARLAELDARPHEAGERLEVLNDLAWSLRLLDHSRSAEKAREVIELAQRQGDRLSEARAKRTLAMVTSLTETPKLALDLCQQALTIYVKEGVELGQAEVHDYLASIYEVLGDFKTAMSHALRALELSRKIGDRMREGFALSSVGGIEAATGDLEGAHEQLVMALDIFEELQHPLGLSRVAHRLGRLCLKLGKIDQAREYHERALTVSRENGVRLGQAFAISSLGEIEEARGDLFAARKCYEEALDRFPPDIAASLGSETRLALGRIHLKNGELSSARTVLEQALEGVRRRGVRFIEEKLCRILAEVVEKQGDCEGALSYLKRALELKESLASDETRSAIKRMEVRLEVESARKDAEINRLKYVELEQMQARLVQAEKAALLGNLAAGIAHELNTPLGVLRSNQESVGRAQEILQRELEADEHDGIERSPALARVVRALSLTRESSENALRRMGGIARSLRRFVHLDEADFQEIDVNADLESALTLLELNLPPRILLERNLKPVSKILGWPRQLNQVYLSVLMNARQAIDGDGRIHVETDEADDVVLVRIRDTGRGIAQEDLARIFEVGWDRSGDRVHLRLGLSAALGTMKQHGGDIHIASVPGEGTTVTLSLPIGGVQPPASTSPTS